MGNPYIILKGGPDTFGGIQCNFDTGYEEEIAKLIKGQRIAIFGEIKGLVFMHVQVDGCEFTDMPIVVKKAVAAK